MKQTKSTDVTKTKWTRNCSVCNKLLYYRSVKQKCHASWADSSCKDCGKKKSHNKSLYRNCPNCKNIIYYRSKLSLLNARHARAWCSKCRNSGKNNPFYGKQHTEFNKRRLRNTRRVRLGNINVAFNKKACEYFNRLNERNGWSGHHAMNGGEHVIDGYFVDYYEPHLNIVIEYDEPHHEKPSVKKKDRIRQQNIITATQCKFYRYSEKHQLLYEAT